MPTHVILLKTLKKSKKQNKKREREDVTVDYSTDTLISNFTTVLNHVIYLKQFLIDIL